MGAAAALGGAGPDRASVLGVSMTALQVAIGSLNDLRDAPSDAGMKPGKPIPRGLVSPSVAGVVVVAAALGGLMLAAIVGGPSLLALALVVLGIGAVYDLWAKGTPLSWLPFALGIPILPLYGWLGATGGLPAWFPILLPAGIMAGAALAIANARADAERDRAAGRSSIAVWLGLGRSWWVSSVLLVVAVLLVIGWAPRLVEPPFVVPLAAGLILVAIGAVLAYGGGPSTRERAWQLQAVGVGSLAVGWIAAVTS